MTDEKRGEITEARWHAACSDGLKASAQGKDAMVARQTKMLCWLLLAGCAESSVPSDMSSSLAGAGGSAGVAGRAGAEAGTGGSPVLPIDAATPDAHVATMTDAGTGDASTVAECAHSGAPPKGPEPSFPEPCLTSYEGPCPTVYLDLQGQPFEVDDPSTLEDARCVLRALRDRTPGYYWFVTEYSPGFGMQVIAETRHGYHMLPDGTAISAYDRWHDFTSERRWSHVTPKPAAYFDTCLALPFGSALYDCFIQWSELATPTTCPTCEG